MGESVKTLVFEVDVPERKDHRCPDVIGTFYPELRRMPLKQTQSGDAALAHVQVELPVRARAHAGH